MCMQNWPGFVYSTPFPFHFLVHLQFKLVSSLLGIFANQMTSEMISQMIECYQSSCLFAVSQNRWGQKIPLILINTQYQNSLKWLWNDMKANSPTGFQNVDSTRVVFLE